MLGYMRSPEQPYHQPIEPSPAEPVAPPSRSVAETLQRLEQAVGAIHDSATFRAYLDVQARFHHYSWGNVLLIGLQFPAATRVAGYQTWRQLDRQVRRGERGIRILVPTWRKDKDDPDAEPQLFFGSGHVFDIS